MLGSTGAAVQAWENQGHKPGGNYNTNPYVEDVRRGMNFILSKSYPYPIHIEDSRDPDTLFNGYGIHSVYESQLYETGIVLMALASAGDSSLTSEVGGFGMLGRTYGAIAQDMVDFLAFAQNEPDVGVWRGGWRYAPNFDQSDMSVTQWPVIGLEAAESNFGTTVPQYVKDELEIYLAADQDPDGGFGYTAPGGNVARTGAGIACLAWIGVVPTDTRVTSAIGFIDNNWAWDNMGNLYAMYAVMKGMRGFQPDLTMIGSHDWYAEYADFLIGNQYGEGSWTSDVWFGRDLSTAAGVLILSPEVFVSPPVAVARASPREASPNTVITFDHSQSFHRDPQRSLVVFRWDFDEDGAWDFETGDITANPTWSYDDQVVCGEEVQHLAVLEVEDDLGNTDVDDETVVIRINLNNHPPVADGDPTDSYPNYYVIPGETVVLDASQSYDPDEAQGDFITNWEWDLNNDGTFDASGETYEFLAPEDWQPGSLHTVTLRVTDDGTWAVECGGVANLVDETTVILAVGAGLECSNAEPSMSRLWPPDHEMVDVNILGLNDSQGNSAEITITAITQDEPVNGLGDGDHAPDGAGVGTSTARVRAERSGLHNGRVYTIRFIAKDDAGATCEGSVSVYVPHDKKDEAIDDGQLYDSTQQQ
jgi:PKD repeat protein